MAEQVPGVIVGTIAAYTIPEGWTFPNGIGGNGATATAGRVVWPGYREIIINPPPPMSAEEQERVRKVREERAAIEARAKALFLRCLTERQRNDFDDHCAFVVKGSEGGRYLVHCNFITYNVHRIRNGEKAERYCAYPRGLGSAWDVYLAQKLQIESDEKEFLGIANVG